MLRLRKRGQLLVAPAEARTYRDLVVFAVTARRATLREALIPGVGRDGARRIERASGIDLGRKPSAVPFPGWLALFAAFQAEAGGASRRAIEGAEERLRAEQAALERTHRTRTPGRAGARASGG